MTKQTVCAYIGLGSNMQHPKRQVNQAILELKRLPETNLVSRSSLYTSSPLPTPNSDVIQDDFINAVVKINTTLEPVELLHYLQKIEIKFGRTRNGHRWGPRILDLDLLMYGNLSTCTAELTLPHYAIAERDFVLVPLEEIEPNLIIPGAGPVCDLITQCENNYTVKLKPIGI